MIVEADFIGESHVTEGAFVSEAIVKMFSFNMIFSAGDNFMRVATECTMIFSIISFLKKLNQLFWISKSVS